MTQQEIHPDFSNSYISSDTHYGHNNVIKYCNRPYLSPDQMDEDLIKNHNSIVPPNGIFYHVGDVSYRSPEQTVEIFKRLNGRKILIRGNHDNRVMVKELLRSGAVEQVKEYLELFDKTTKMLIVLMHYPVLEWRSSHHGSIHLHGHCHGKIDELNKGLLRKDIGVDSNNYKPLSFTQIIEEMRVRASQLTPGHRYTSSNLSGKV